MSKKDITRPMKEITIGAAKSIAQRFGYDQVVIVARRVGQAPDPFGEHVTTYGVDAEHCNVAARIGDFLKYRVMGWPTEEGRRVEAAIKALGVHPVTKDLPLAKLGEIATAVFEAAAKS